MRADIALSPRRRMPFVVPASSVRRRPGAGCRRPPEHCGHPSPIRDLVGDTLSIAISERVRVRPPEPLPEPARTSVEPHVGIIVRRTPMIAAFQSMCTCYGLVLYLGVSHKSGRVGNLIFQ
jgi:hypothetical protein